MTEAEVAELQRPHGEVLTIWKAGRLWSAKIIRDIYISADWILW